MPHHKRRKPKHQRAGCLMCKPHKDERAAKQPRSKREQLELAESPYEEDPMRDELAPGWLERGLRSAVAEPARRLPERCRFASEYQGIRAPTCSGGGGCRACWGIYDARHKAGA